jgi:hypothetical protein
MAEHAMNIVADLSIANIGDDVPGPPSRSMSLHSKHNDVDNDDSDEEGVVVR